jgi:chemotaxis signal transduction protein
VTEELHDLVPAAVVQLGSLSVAVPTTGVERVATAMEILRVPLSPRTLAGVAVVAGEPAAVVDLAALLGAPRAPRSGAETAVVCRTSIGLLALLGGRIRWVGRLRRTGREVRCVAASGAVEWRGTVVPLVDPELVVGVMRSGEASEGEGRP